MQKLSLSFFSTRSTGSLITRVSSDTDRLWDFITFGIIEIIVAVLQIIGVAIALLVMDWSLAVLVLIPLPLMTWLFYRHSQKIQILFLRIWRKWSAMTRCDAFCAPSGETLVSSAMVPISTRNRSIE